jgi:hypothetical protein
MEIEQKESREETLKGFGVYHVDGAEYNVDEDVFFKEIFKLEAEIKALREAAQNLVTAIEQRSFFQEGYRNGSASISEVMAAGDVEVKAYEAMGKLLTKNEG